MPDYVIAVRDLRSRLGMTQEDFAGALGITVSTVCRWEKGSTRPSMLAAASMNRMAGIRGVDAAAVVAALDRSAL
jgi:putative transcriptional regulator